MRGLTVGGDKGILATDGLNLAQSRDLVIGGCIKVGFEHNGTQPSRPFELQNSNNAGVFLQEEKKVKQTF